MKKCTTPFSPAQRILNIYVILTGNLEVGRIVYRIPVDAVLEEGTYSGKVVTEKLTPISLLLN